MTPMNQFNSSHETNERSVEVVLLNRQIRSMPHLRCSAMITENPVKWRSILAEVRRLASSLVQERLVVQISLTLERIHMFCRRCREPRRVGWRVYWGNVD